MPLREPGLTVKQVAQRLGTNPESVRRWIRSKQLLASKHPTALGLPYLIQPADLASFIAKRRTGSSI